MVKYGYSKKDWRYKMFKVSFSGNCGFMEIIVADEKSLANLMAELNDKYNKNKITVTFNIEDIDNEKKI